MRSSLLLVVLLGCHSTEAPTLRVGSKVFTESVILGELATQLAQNTGADVGHRRELGGTQIVWKALLAGDIDIYPEYTGTIREEIFAGQEVKSEEALRAALSAKGIGMSAPLGFNDTYALGVREELAARLGLSRISDLVAHPTLRLGLSNEFMARQDGWPGLRARYQLPQEPRGLAHDLAYRALETGDIELTDLYSTDAEIPYYKLRVLEDDLHYFPEYQAVFLYRLDLAQRSPDALKALRQLEGTLSAQEMSALNASAKLEHIPEAKVAADFLGATRAPAEAGLLSRLWARTLEHLFLVLLSLGASLLVALPLGIFAAKRPRLGQVVLGLIGVIQTIPTLALLVFLIPVFGIGTVPAIFALFLYSLLPIVRNTHAGLLGIPSGLLESAQVLGLSAGARLWQIELPLASPQILAGIKTSAVLCIGYATLGALIGAGGYGQPILTGIRLDDTRLLLEGAIPSAGLALLAQGLFEVVERRLLPRGLRSNPS
jgi:osmoprotectant transport system permease protein